MTFPVPPGFPQAPQGQAPAPAPMSYGMPAPAQPTPGYPPQTQQAPPGYGPPAAPPPGYLPQGYGPPSAPPAQLATAFGPGAFAGATVTTPRNPSPAPGHYTFKLKRCFLRRERSSTFIADLEILQTSNPSFPAGMTVGFIQSLHDSPYATAQDILSTERGRIGTGQILAMIMASCGFMNEAEFKTQCPTWTDLISASFDDKQQLPGNAWPANPLAGRVMSAFVTDSGKKTRAKGQSPGGEAIMRFDWRPVPAGA